MLPLPGRRIHPSACRKSAPGIPTSISTGIGKLHSGCMRLQAQQQHPCHHFSLFQARSGSLLTHKGHSTRRFGTADSVLGKWTRWCVAATCLGQISRVAICYIGNWFIGKLTGNMGAIHPKPYRDYGTSDMGGTYESYLQAISLTHSFCNRTRPWTVDRSMTLHVARVKRKWRRGLEAPWLWALWDMDRCHASTITC